MTALGVPQTLAVTGALFSSSGGPVADGTYVLMLRLHDAEKAGQVLFSELHASVKVSSGHFAVIVGAQDPKKPIPGGLFASGKAIWVGVQVAGDPELPRSRLHSVPFAMQAARAGVAKSVQGKIDGQQLLAASVSTSALKQPFAASDKPGGAAKWALGIQCTGCVDMGAIKWTKDLYMTKNVLVAGKVSANNISGGTVAAAKLYGDGSGISNLPLPNGQCQGDKVVYGINPDGSLRCRSTSMSFHGDMLGMISYNSLTNSFVQTVASSKVPMAIVDNHPMGVVDTIDVPDIGTASGFRVSLSIKSSDLKQVNVTLRAPNGALFTLLKAGVVTGKGFSTSFPKPTKTASGDLTKLYGTNLKGKWTLRVVDSGDSGQKTDGEISSWAIAVVTLEKSAVRAVGKLHATGGIHHYNMPAEGFRLGDCPVKLPTCTSGMRGALCSDPGDGALRYCNGKSWGKLFAAPTDGSGAPGSG